MTDEHTGSEPETRPLSTGERALEPLVERDRAVETLRRWQRGIRAIADADDALTGGTRRTICEQIVDVARTVFDDAFVALLLYDEESGSLAPVSSYDGRRTAETPPPGEYVDSVWDVFVESTPRLFTEDSDLPFERSMAIPLDRHGVFVVASDRPDALDELDADIARLVAMTAERALTLDADDERRRECESTVDRQRAELDRLERTNDVVREVTRAVRRAASREEIERSACELLASTDPYQHVWIGDRTSGETIQVNAWAGEGGISAARSADPDDRGPRSDGTDGGPLGRPLAETALETNEAQIVDAVLDDPRAATWRNPALTRGIHSMLAVPLTYNGSAYGVLCVCANRPHAFNERERATLIDLGQTIAHAINALESKRALLTDATVELEFAIRGSGVRPLQLTERVDCTFDYKGTVRHSGDSSTVFFTTDGADPEQVSAVVDQCHTVEELDCLARRGDRCFFECLVNGPTIATTLVDHGAIPRSITAEGETLTVVAGLPRSGNVRRLVDALQSRYPQIELVARRERTRSPQTIEEFQGLLDSILTDRQLEVLQTAYLSGFFESPRESTGEEIAELLGISQPTVNHHLRTAQRKLFTALFDDSG